MNFNKVVGEILQKQPPARAGAVVGEDKPGCPPPTGGSGCALFSFRMMSDTRN
jgi:hypothetical protein